MQMRLLTATAVVVIAALVAVPGAAQSVQIELSDGRATVYAQDATIAEILAEWARVGDVTVVDGEQLAASRVTLQLVDVPEGDALRTVLRAAAGYVVAARPDAAGGQSVFDRILVLPASSASAGQAFSGASPTYPEPGYEDPAYQDPAAMMADPSAGVAPYDDPGAMPMPAGDMEPAVMDQSGAVAVNPYLNYASPDLQAPETNFDYANPQEILQRRQREAAARGNAATTAAAPGAAVPTQGPTATPAGGQTSSRPGEIIQPPQPQAIPPGYMNPYGLPDNVVPGSATAPPMEPDRAKYANPYQPQPPGE